MGGMPWISSDLLTGAQDRLSRPFLDIPRPRPNTWVMTRGIATFPGSDRVSSLPAETMPKKEQLPVAGWLGAILLLLAALIVLAVLLVGRIRSAAEDPSPEELPAQEEQAYREAMGQQRRLEEAATVYTDDFSVDPGWIAD